MPELAETTIESPAVVADEPVARIEDDDDDESDDTIPDLEDAGKSCDWLVFGRLAQSISVCVRWAKGH